MGITDLSQYFFDTSALVKYYHTEAGSDQVAAIFEEPNRRIRISRLGVVEMRSALGIKVRSGFLTRQAAELQLEHLAFDISDGSIEVFSVTESHFSWAERLIARYSYASRLRTMDAIQLAVALDLADAQLVRRFVTADKVLAQVAELESLPVTNPGV